MIGWAIETLVASSLLMLLVLAIRAPVRRIVGPQIAYALWALPLLRMLLPPMPEAWREAGVAPVAAASELIAHYVILDPAPVAAAEAGLPWAAMAIALWSLGALGFIGWHLVAYSRFCARLTRGARRRTELVEGRVAMIESDAAAGPLAFGIWRKYVAFPTDFAERYDDLERDLALAHELGHHARGDLAANWAALAVLGIHWFNPIAWRAFRAFRADQEMACDALVLAGRHPALRHAYGRAIVKSAHGGAVSAACHLHTINEIKGRLRMLTRHQKLTPGAARAGLAGIAALTLTGLALTASGTRAAENLKAKVEDRMGVSIDDIELPALPAAPQAPEPLSPPEPAAAPAAPEAPAAIEAPDSNATYVYRARDGKRTIVLRESQRLDQAEIDAKVAEARRSAAEAARKAADAGRRAGEAGRRAGEAARQMARVRVPEISKLRCGGDGPASYVVRGDDGHTVARTVLCVDRVEAHAEAAGRHAADGQRAERIALAYATTAKREGINAARASLRSARAAIMADQNLTAEERREALDGLREAMHELEAEAHAVD